LPGGVLFPPGFFLTTESFYRASESNDFNAGAHNENFRRFDGGASRQGGQSAAAAQQYRAEAKPKKKTPNSTPTLMNSHNLRNSGSNNSAEFVFNVGIFADRRSKKLSVR
jgi:hypothetical protein